jgi:hypothetical protein
MGVSFVRQRVVKGADVEEFSSWRGNANGVCKQAGPARSRGRRPRRKGYVIASEMGMSELAVTVRAAPVCRLHIVVADDGQPGCVVGEASGRQRTWTSNGTPSRLRPLATAGNRCEGCTDFVMAAVLA